MQVFPDFITKNECPVDIDNGGNSRFRYGIILLLIQPLTAAERLGIRAQKEGKSRVGNKLGMVEYLFVEYAHGKT